MHKARLLAVQAELTAISNALRAESRGRNDFDDHWELLLLQCASKFKAMAQTAGELIVKLEASDLAL